MSADRNRPLYQTFFKRLAAELGTGPLLLIVFLLGWEFVVRAFEVRPAIFPSPSRVLLEVSRAAGLFWRHAQVTGMEALTGLFLAALAAFPSAAVMIWSTRTHHLTRPVLSLLQRLPLITLTPLMVIWVGFGRPSATAIAFLVCLLPLIANLRAGFDSIPLETLEIMEAMGASPAGVFLKVRLPACLPFLAHALKLSIPVALGGAAVAECVGSNRGLGYLMIYAGSRAEMTQLFAVLAVLFLMALFGHFCMCLIESAFISWPVELPGWHDFGRQIGVRGEYPDRKI